MAVWIHSLISILCNKHHNTWKIILYISWQMMMHFFSNTTHSFFAACAFALFHLQRSNLHQSQSILVLIKSSILDPYTCNPYTLSNITYTTEMLWPHFKSPTSILKNVLGDSWPLNDRGQISWSPASKLAHDMVHMHILVSKCNTNEMEWAIANGVAVAHSDLAIYVYT